MFNWKTVKAQEAEIQFLRRLVIELTDKVTILAGKNLELNQYLVSKDTTPLKAPTTIDLVTGELLSMAADTKEEKRQKKDALNELLNIQGH